MSVSGKQTARILLASLTLGLLATSLLPAHNVAAVQITNRALTLQDGTTDGGSKPGGVVKHQFTFTIPSTNNVGSIKFLYCDTASGPPTNLTQCTTPTGLVTTSATLTNQLNATGFSMVNTTNGSPYIARASATSIASGTAVTYQLSNVTNPTATNQTFYVRISTYASLDTTGSPIDTGVVAGSTATQIVLTGIMPESLIFCTGALILTNGGGIPDCSTATSGAISFDRLFSPADTATTTSQMAASTNALSGYSITVDGTTLTSGSNTIPNITTATTGVRGTRQFGMNLVANTTTTSTPAVGINVAPAPNGTTLKGQPATGYGTADNFQYNSGDSVAKSDNGGAGPTDAQIYTASYIVNVSGGTPAGTYTTTLTYICTATF
jgi:hypothetical protein